MGNTSRLDKEFPQGDPYSRTCRWCGGAKGQGRVSGWVCPPCDTPKPDKKK